MDEEKEQIRQSLNAARKALTVDFCKKNALDFSEMRRGLARLAADDEFLTHAAIEMSKG